MATLVLIIHVVGAVFIFGPLAILPMTGLRALRRDRTEQIRGLAQSLNIFTWLSLVVALAGIVYVPLAPEQWHLSLSTGWVLWSIVLTAVAIALSFIVVIPRMKSAANIIEAAPGTRAGEESATSASAHTKPAEYSAIAASSGIVSLLLVVVAILMVIH